jgi:hypothetical protein
MHHFFTYSVALQVISAFFNDLFFVEKKYDLLYIKNSLKLFKVRAKSSGLITFNFFHTHS